MNPAPSPVRAGTGLFKALNTKFLTLPITAEEMDESAKQLQSHPQLDEMLYGIHDFTGVTDALLEEEDIHFLAIRASVSLQRSNRFRIAFVGMHPVVSALIDAFNGSMYAKHRIQRFETLQDARKFIADGLNAKR